MHRESKNRHTPTSHKKMSTLLHTSNSAVCVKRHTQKKLLTTLLPIGQAALSLALLLALSLLLSKLTTMLRIFRCRRISGKSHSLACPSSRCPPTYVWSGRNPFHLHNGNLHQIFYRHQVNHGLAPPRYRSSFLQAVTNLLGVSRITSGPLPSPKRRTLQPTCSRSPCESQGS